MRVIWIGRVIEILRRVDRSTNLILWVDADQRGGSTVRWWKFTRLGSLVRGDIILENDYGKD